jgi:hypothetical protein
MSPWEAFCSGAYPTKIHFQTDSEICGSVLHPPSDFHGVSIFASARRLARHERDKPSEKNAAAALVEWLLGQNDKWAAATDVTTAPPSASTSRIIEANECKVVGGTVVARCKPTRLFDPVEEPLVDAARVAAGPNALRGSDPNRFHAGRTRDRTRPSCRHVRKFLPRRRPNVTRHTWRPD